MRCSDGSLGSLGHIVSHLDSEPLAVSLEVRELGDEAVEAIFARALGVREVVGVDLANEEISHMNLVTEEELARVRDKFHVSSEELRQDLVEELVLLLLGLDWVLLEENSRRNLGEHIVIVVNDPVMLQLLLRV